MTATHASTVGLICVDRAQIIDALTSTHWWDQDCAVDPDYYMDDSVALAHAYLDVAEAINLLPRGQGVHVTLRHDREGVLAGIAVEVHLPDRLTPGSERLRVTGGTVELRHLRPERDGMAGLVEIAEVIIRFANPLLAWLNTLPDTTS